MKKRIFTLLTILCLLLQLLPVSALAATSYELYINEFQFTSSSLTYKGSSGTAVYNPSTNTLTLNSLKTSTNGYSTILYANLSKLNIVLKGTSELTQTRTAANLPSDKSPYAAVSLDESGTYSITGDSASSGKLIINSTNSASDTSSPSGTTCIGIGTGLGSSLTIDKATIQVTDNSASSFAGHCRAITVGGALTVTNASINSTNCQHGVFDESQGSTIKFENVAFNITGAASGIDLYTGTQTMKNVTGTVSGDTPLFVQGSLTISGESSSELNLKAASDGVVIAGGTLNLNGQKLIVTTTASGADGIQCQESGKLNLNGSEVRITHHGNGLCSTAATDSITMSSGTLSLTGSDASSSIGIKSSGTVSITGGTLTAANEYVGVQPVSKNVSISGGTQTFSATVGYANGGSANLLISGSANTTFNSKVAIQLTKSLGGGLTQSGGSLKLNYTQSGINAQSGAGALQFSGGTATFTDTNSSSGAIGIMTYPTFTVNGGTLNFSNNYYDIVDYSDGNSKIQSGSVNLTGVIGLTLGDNFTLSGGTLSYQGSGYGINGQGGTYTFSGGKLDIQSGSYGIFTDGDYTMVLAFTGAECQIISQANCAVAIQGTGSGFSVTGGSLVLQSTSAGINVEPTSLGANYGVWAGSSSSTAALVASPTQPTYAGNAYVKIAPKTLYTLTLVNVDGATSATYYSGAATASYKAKTAEAGKHFSHWELTVNGKTTNVGTSATCSVTMPEGNATLTAVYDACSGGTATCTALAVCSVCGKTYGSLAAHTPQTIPAVPATCKETGLTEGSKCSVCGTILVAQTETPLADHTPEPIPAVPATCKETGLTEGSKCSVCGTILVAQTETPLADHTPEPIPAVPATCQETGLTEGSKCSVCGTILVAQTETPLADHTPEPIPAVPATCKETGLTEGSKCSVCGKILVAQTETPLADHTPEPIPAVPATCKETGLTEGSKCSVCGTILVAQTETPLGDHTPEPIPAVPATCQTTGLTEGSKCSVCGKILTEQTETPLGEHTPEPIPAVPATCQTTGLTEGSKCSVCGKILTEQTETPLGEHTPETIPAVPATCQTPGLTEGSKCSVCGKILTAQQETARGGHTLAYDKGTATLTAGYHCSVCGEVLAAQCPIYSTRWDAYYDEALYASDAGNWVIYDAEDLAAFAKKVNNGSSFAGFTVTLAADIDLAGHTWIPIGVDWSHVFNGTFDGNLHTIKNMEITSSIGVSYFGLFGYLQSSGCVRNVYVYGDVWQDSGTSTANVGGIVGDCEGGTIYNCGFIGNLFSQNKRYGYPVGGIVGCLFGGSVRNCFSGGTYFGRTVYYYGSNPTTPVGGIVGSYYSGENSVVNCYSMASVSSWNEKGQSSAGLIRGNLSDWSPTKCVSCYALSSAFCCADTIVIQQTPISKAELQSTLADNLNAWVKQASSEYAPWVYDETKGYPVFSCAVRLMIDNALYELRIVSQGQTVTLPAAGAFPASPTYEFRGWFTDEACEIPVTAEDLTISGNITFYAKWVLRDDHPHEYGECQINDAGRHYRVCTLCGASEVCACDETVIPPSCVDAGYTSCVCSVCSVTYTCDTTEALGHDYIDHEAQPATCTEIGWDAYQTCSRCDYTTYVALPAIGHDYIDHEAQPATCTEIGWDAYQTCSRCDYTSYAEISALGHDYIDHEAQPATCTEIGWDAYQTCSRCDYTTYAELPAIGHDYIDHVAQPATCTEIGWDAYQTCSRCDYTTYAELPAIGHDYIDHEAQPATCTEIGWDAYQTCSRCDYTSYAEISALGHDFVEGICTRCGEEDPDYIPPCPSKGFTDVPAKPNWAHEGIDYCIAHKLMYGISETEFSPDGTITRAQLVTILYRMEGSPAVVFSGVFSDVAGGKYYADAVEWAAANDIVSGISETEFAPEHAATREQIVTILYRYVGSPEVSGDLSAYPDADKVSDFAKEAMLWTTQSGIIVGAASGDEVLLNPKADATRAEFAAIIMRFLGGSFRCE